MTLCRNLIYECIKQIVAVYRIYFIISIVMCLAFALFFFAAVYTLNIRKTVVLVQFASTATAVKKKQ